RAARHGRLDDRMDEPLEQQGRAEVIPLPITPAARIGARRQGCESPAMKSILFGKRSWRELLFLLSGLPFGIAWFTVLVTGWSLTLGLLVTPLVIPLAMGLGGLIRGLAAVEASLARDALGIRVYPPHRPFRRGGLLRRSFGWLADASMWRAQGYLAYRAVIGFALGTAIVALLGGSLEAITAPLYYHFIHGGLDVGFTHIDSLPKALAAVPVGLAGFVVTM